MKIRPNENESYIIYNLKTKEVVEDHLKPMSDHALRSAARRVVDIINLLWSELAAQVLDGLRIHLLDKWKHPHSLVGLNTAGKYRHGSQNA